MSTLLRAIGVISFVIIISGCAAEKQDNGAPQGMATTPSNVQSIVANAPGHAAWVANHKSKNAP